MLFFFIDIVEKDFKCLLNNIILLENLFLFISFEFDSMDDIDYYVLCFLVCEIINEVLWEVSYIDSYFYCDWRESMKLCLELNEEESVYMCRNSSKKLIWELCWVSLKRCREGLSMCCCEFNLEEDFGIIVERIIYDIFDELKEEMLEISRKVLFYNNSDDLLENRSIEIIIVYLDIESEINNWDIFVIYVCLFK